MSKLSVLVLAIIGFSGVFSTPVSKSPNFIWWPKDDGSGVVPAFLDSSASSTRASIKAPYDDIKFVLYTQSTQNSGYELYLRDHNRLESSAFDRSAPVKIIAHGFSSSLSGGFTSHTKNAYLNAKHVNVIAVDWSALAAAPWYDVAAGHTRLVGQKTAEFVRFLVAEGIPLPQIHMIGHSLGAHVAGFTGASLDGQMTRITGLDAALPLFGNLGDDERIDPTDAVFVDVIHTAGGGILEGGLAFRDPRGDADYYPNEGEHQPGCGADAFGTCSHSRAYEYFGESIANENGFSSCKCVDWEDFLGSCTCSNTGVMGEATSSNALGLYFLHTNPQSPFARG